MIRSQIRDDINARGLAVWKDSGETDFTLTVRVPSFQIRSYGEYKTRLCCLPRQSGWNSSSLTAKPTPKSGVPA